MSTNGGSTESRARLARPALPGSPATGPQGSARRVGVLVADRLPVVRRGVAAAVRRRWDLELSGEAADGAEALVLIRQARPDVALVDVKLGVVDGFRLMSVVRQEGLPTRLIVFAEDGDGDVVHRAIAAGAAGCITKNEPIEGICEAIRRVGAGDSFLSDEARDALWIHLRRSEPAPRPDLTPRETEILRLLATGETSAAIGAALHLSASTVKNHLHRIYEKLGVSTSAAAVHRAMREGVLE